MKKTFFITLIFVFILRGGNTLKAQDSIAVFLNYQLSDTSCFHKYRVTVNQSSTALPIEYMLDSVWKNNTGIFENVSGGEHFMDVKDKNGKIGRRKFYLTINNYPFYLNAKTILTNCGDTKGKLIIEAFGIRPLQFKLDNGIFQQDTFFNDVAFGYHSLTVKDARGCEIQQSIKVENSFRASYSYDYKAQCNQTADFSILTSDVDLSFKLNQVQPNSITTNNGRKVHTWQGIKPDNHTITAIKGACTTDENIKLEATGMAANFSLVTDSCGNDSTSVYRLNVSGGEAPYTYYLNGNLVPSNNNTFRLQAFSNYQVKIQDKNNCTFEGNLTTPQSFYNYSYLQLYSEFVPNKCGDSIGTIKVHLFKSPAQDSLLAYPLSMSFDGRPFSSDTVFNNIKVTEAKSYTIKVKTKQGCELTASSYIAPPYLNKAGTFDLSNYFSIDNCKEKTGNLNLYAGGATRPYRFYINNQLISAEDTGLVKNIKIGTYTIKVISAEGCEVTQQVNLKDNLWLRYQYYSPTCDQPMPFKIYSHEPNSVIRFNNQLGAKDSLNNLNWENVKPGKYLVEIIDSVGCVRSDTFKLYGSGLKIEAESLQTSCNDSSSFSYKLNVTNGVGSFYFNINYDTAKITNNIVQLREGFNFIRAYSSDYCTGDLQLNVLTSNDSVRTSSNFEPNSCGSDLGTLSFTILDANVARPLSISFNGQPFSSDTVFRNVSKSKAYSFIAKSKLGCNLQGTVYIPQIYELTSGLRTQCADRSGRGSVDINIYGGTAPFTFKWDGVGTLNFKDMPTGDYKITVTDAAGCTNTKRAFITTCVWSGDTDTSGIVDHNDLLNIGLAYSETGPRRISCSLDTCIQWSPQLAGDWSKQTPTRVNFKHIDTNGDGVINVLDTIAIRRNWSKTRQLLADAPSNLLASPPLFIQTGRVNEGQWASFPIMLGDATTPANGIYGLAFTIAYPTSLIDASSMYFTHQNQSWLGFNNDLLTISQNRDGFFDLALTKINHSNSNGNGPIGQLHFKVKNGVRNQPLTFEIKSPQLINSDAQILPTSPQSTTTNISTSVAEPEWASQITVQPNPTSGDFFIETQDLNIEQILILDISGKVMSQYLKPARNAPLSISTFGTFFLKIQTDKGVISRKIVKL